MNGQQWIWIIEQNCPCEVPGPADTEESTHSGIELCFYLGRLGRTSSRCLGLCLFTALHMFIVHKLLKFEFGTSLVTQLSAALSKRAQVGIKSASATTRTTTTTASLWTTQDLAKYAEMGLNLQNPASGLLPSPTKNTATRDGAFRNWDILQMSADVLAVWAGLSLQRWWALSMPRAVAHWTWDTICSKLANSDPRLGNAGQAAERLQ